MPPQAGGPQVSRLDEFEEALIAIGATVASSARQPEDADGTDLIAAEAAIDIIIERWQSDDVQWVVVLDGAVGAVVAGLERAGRTDIGVVWAGRDIATPTALGGDPLNLENFLGVGAPLGDRVYQEGLYGTSECVALVSERLGITMEPLADEGRDATLGVALRVCAAWETFVTLAEAAGPNLTEDSFLQAGYDLGDYEMTGFASARLEPGRSHLANEDAVVHVLDDSGLFVPR